MTAAQAKRIIKYLGFRVVTEKFPGGNYGHEWVLYDQDNHNIADGCTLTGTVTEALNDAAEVAQKLATAALDNAAEVAQR